MPWTPLHVALGEVSSSVDFALIERACEMSVPESTNLDWKQKLPLTADVKKAKEHQQQELAKDIAAMANTGGGMIVYGVAEDRSPGTSAADHIEAVGAVDESTLRPIRQVAGSLIYPPVTGLQLLPVSPAERPMDGVLVLIVPDSPEAPHLVHPSNPREWFGAPYRHGPDTDWMVERQLATAFAARESGRRQRSDSFNSRFDAFTSTLPGDPSTRWIVVQAVPDVPRPRPRDLTLFAAHRLISRAWRSPLVSSFGPRELTGSTQTGRGVQRFTRRGDHRLTGAPGAVVRGHVEVHGDGSVVVAFTRDGAIDGEGRQLSQVPIADIEATALDFFALLWRASQELSVTSDYTARLAVHPSTEIFRRSDSDSTVLQHFQPWNEDDRVYGYAPIDGPIITGEGLDTALSSWIDLVTDAVNQAGATCYLDVNQLITKMQLDD